MHVFFKESRKSTILGIISVLVYNLVVTNITTTSQVLTEFLRVKPKGARISQTF